MYTFKSLSDLENDYLTQMDANGIPFEGPLKCDGEVHRFSADAQKNQPDEWYVCHSGFSARGNPYLICTYGTWSGSQEQYTYKSYDAGTILSHEERLAIKAKEKERQKSLHIGIKHV